MEHRYEQIASLFLLTVHGSAPARPGAAFAVVYRSISEALDPVLGKRGVTALFRRTLVVAEAAYPWLADPDLHLSADDGFDALATALDRQPLSEAVAAGSSLLRSFCHLLDSLVGPSLTERLLQPVLANHSSGPAARDAPP